MKLLSVVVPCYNEADVIRETHRRLMAALDEQVAFRLELVYVNDGSKDGTAEILRELQTAHPEVVTLVLLARNFGHQRAVTAGLEQARGDAVVLIDADLQDPPEVVLEFWAKWQEGYQVVYGRRASREGESAFKLVTAKSFYRLLNWMSEVPIPLDTGDFRLMDRRVVEVLRAMPEQDRFLRGMVAWAGFRQIAHPYHRAKRFAGESKYPLWKMLRFAIDGLISFSSTPLRLASQMGLASIVLSALGILYALCIRLFTQNWVSGWAFLIIAICFFGGAQLFCLGLLGEYVGRIYHEVKRRPLYVLDEVRPADLSASVGGAGRNVE